MLCVLIAVRLFCGSRNVLRIGVIVRARAVPLGQEAVDEQWRAHVLARLVRRRAHHAYTVDRFYAN